MHMEGIVGYTKLAVEISVFGYVAGTLYRISNVIHWYAIF